MSEQAQLHRNLQNQNSFDNPDPIKVETQSGNWVESLNQVPRVTTQARFQEVLNQRPQTLDLAKMADTIQRKCRKCAGEEDLQPGLGVGQLKTGTASHQAGSASSRTGLPEGLKTGMESLSGLSLDDVRVHYNSAKPAQLQALAYTQGTDIHVAPGEETNLPHEAWHVVQQKQGRVAPTTQMKGIAVNDDSGLEQEADRMGAQAVQRVETAVSQKPVEISQPTGLPSNIQQSPIQFGRKGGGYKPSKNELKWKRKENKFQNKQKRKQQEFIEWASQRPSRHSSSDLSAGNPLMALMFLLLIGGAYGVQVANNITSNQTSGLSGGRYRNRTSSSGFGDDSHEDTGGAVALYHGTSPTTGFQNVTSGVDPFTLNPFGNLGAFYNFTALNTSLPRNESSSLIPWQSGGGLLPTTPTGVQTPLKTLESPSPPQFEGVDRLRIGVQHAKGFGHQTVALDLIQDLMDQRFSGQLHLIFQNFTGSENVPTSFKLANLIPGFDPHGKNQTLTFGDINLLATEEEFFKNTTTLSERLPLGLVGAKDKHDDTQWRESLNVDNLLALQPYAWVTEPEERYLETSEGDIQTLPIPLSATYQYPFVDPWEQTLGGGTERYSALESFGQKALIGQPPEIQAKLPGWLQLLNATRSGENELLPIYGLHHPHVQPKTTNLLRNLAGGARFFQRQQQNPRPIILALLNELGPGLPPLGVNTTTASIENPNLGDILQGLDPYQILALQTGKIPRPLFQLLYKSATLPAVFEGANTANFLMVNRKPFLSAYDLFTEVPTGSPDVETGFEAVKEVTDQLLSDKYQKGVSGKQKGGISPSGEQFFGQFLVDSRTPSSDVFDYYQDIFQNATSRENRQVLLALEYYQQYRKTKAPLSGNK